MALILIVEDDPESMDLMQVIFTREGHDIIPCSTAEDVNDNLDGRKPDIAVIDIYLPGANGVSLTWDLRNLWDDVPIIITSGFLANWEKDDIVDCGADAVVPKPFEIHDMKEAVNRCLYEGRQDTSNAS